MLPLFVNSIIGYLLYSLYRPDILVVPGRPGRQMLVDIAVDPVYYSYIADRRPDRTG